jgi:6-phosphogluconate dehydrogenase
MKVGMVGLGRTGTNRVCRLLGAVHECVAFDVHPPASGEVAKAGASMPGVENGTQAEKR